MSEESENREGTATDIEASSSETQELSVADRLQYGSYYAANPLLGIVMQTDAGRAFEATFQREIVPSFAWLGGAAVDLVEGFGNSGIRLVTQGDFVNPFNNFGREDNFANSWYRGTRNSIIDITEGTSAGAVQFKSFDDFVYDRIIELKLDPEAAGLSATYPGQEPIPEFIGLTWGELTAEQALRNPYIRQIAEDQVRGEGLEGGHLGYSFSRDNGHTWQPVTADISTAVVLGNLADPTILAGGAGFMGKIPLVGRVSGATRAGFFAVGGVAIADAAVAMIMPDSVDIRQLADLLAREDNYLASGRGMRYLQDALNDVNSNAIDESILQADRRTGEDLPVVVEPMEYLSHTGEMDQETKEALVRSSNLLFRFRDIYSEEGSLGDTRASQAILEIEDRFYALAEAYVSDPENFNPTETDMITMQFWMSGNGFPGFDGEDIQWGLAGKEWTLSYLDTHLDRFPSQRAALMTGRRGEMARASVDETVEPDAGTATGAPLLRSRAEVQADMSQVGNRVENLENQAEAAARRNFEMRHGVSLD